MKQNIDWLEKMTAPRIAQPTKPHKPKAFRRTVYAWFDERQGNFKASWMAPDAPVRRASAYETAIELEQQAYKQKANVIWYPPLTEAQEKLRPKRRDLLFIASGKL